jgi:hypothetical protein
MSGLLAYFLLNWILVTGLTTFSIPNCCCGCSLVRTALGTNSAASNTTVSINNITLNSGDLLVVGLGSAGGDNNSPISVKWGGTNLSNAVNQSGGVATSLGGDIWYLNVVSGGTNNLTATYNSNPVLLIWASKVSGLASNAFELSASTNGSGTTPDSGATGQTSVACELWIGNVGTDGPQGDAAGTWGNSFSNGQRIGRTNVATSMTISEGYLLATTTGTADAAKSGITSRQWIAMVATFD